MLCKAYIELYIVLYIHFWNYHYILVVHYNRQWTDMKYPLGYTLPPSDTPYDTSLYHNSMLMVNFHH